MLSIAGIGPGDPKYLTREVRLAIENSEYTLAFGRVAKSLQSINPNIIQVNKVDEVLEHAEKNTDVLLLASGDPNFYGIVHFIQKKGIEIKDVLPGLSSFQYLMAKLKKSWEKAEFVSLHGRVDSLDQVIDKQLTIILTDKDHNPDYISKKLNQLNVQGKMYIGFNLSYDDEKILIQDIGESVENISPLAVVVIENEMD